MFRACYRSLSSDINSTELSSHLGNLCTKLELLMSIIISGPVFDLVLLVLVSPTPVGDASSVSTTTRCTLFLVSERFLSRKLIEFSVSVSYSETSGRLGSTILFCLIKLSNLILFCPSMSCFSLCLALL